MCSACTPRARTTDILKSEPQHTAGRCDRGRGRGRRESGREQARRSALVADGARGIMALRPPLGLVHQHASDDVQRDVPDITPDCHEASAHRRSTPAGSASRAARSHLQCLRPAPIVEQGEGRARTLHCVSRRTFLISDGCAGCKLERSCKPDTPGSRQIWSAQQSGPHSMLIQQDTTDCDGIVTVSLDRDSTPSSRRSRFSCQDI